MTSNDEQDSLSKSFMKDDIMQLIEDVCKEERIRVLEIIGEDEIVADPKAHWTNNIPETDVPKIYRNQLRTQLRQAIEEWAR